MMRVILFTGESPSKILDGTKTLTARCWRITPPAVGDVVRAQSGQKKDTTFAYLKVLDVRRWNGYHITSADYHIPIDIAKKEGFSHDKQGVFDFLETYRSLNDWCWNDRERKHWFIEFEMVDEIEHDHTGGA